MSDRYDVVIVGGGPNGMGIACYLAKCGLSVCVCEDRLELGGGIENAEPMAGFRIDPHATYFYGAAGPAVKQLELDKFGFRMCYYKGLVGGITSEGQAVSISFYDKEATYRNLARQHKSDADIWQMLLDMGDDGIGELLRSIYWTPPPPPDMNLSVDDLPWVKVLKKRMPLFETSWLDMSLFEILDMLDIKSELFKVMLGMTSWYNGPHPDWAGAGLFAFTCNMLAALGSGSPVGGMHTLAHSVARCAMHHGVRFLTNTKVEEIIIEDGTAKGVIIADDAPVKHRKIYADRAVISGLHVKNTFQDIVAPRHLGLDFKQKVEDISLKGSSLFVLSLVTNEQPKWIGEADKIFEDLYPSCVFLPCDSREIMRNQTRDIDSYNTHPIKPESMMVPIVQHDIYDPTRCPKGYHVLSPIYLAVPPPEDHVDGPMAVNNAKDEIVDAIMTAFRKVAPNMTPDKIVAEFVNTPYDAELRNMGFVGGGWYGSRIADEEFHGSRPLPELSRYRTPISNLYLCNHTSHPGGLALFAVPYNLMHILIEDLDLKPDDWWYPSSHYIKDEE